MKEPLWVDVHSFARTLFDLVERDGAKTPLERALGELAEAVLVQSEDEVVLSGAGDVGSPFLLRYAARGDAGRIRLVVDNYIVVDVGNATGHWFVAPRLLVPGQHVEADGLRLFGRSVSPREALAHWNAMPPVAEAPAAEIITDDAFLRATCAKCGFLREDDGQCYRCGAPKKGTLWE